MGTGAVHQLAVHPRHYAVDERGVGLRATWHRDHGLVNVSLWSGSRCVQTFHLSPLEAGRLVGFLATVLAEAASEGSTGVTPARPESPRTDRLAGLRRDLADALQRAASRLRP